MSSPFLEARSLVHRFPDGGLGLNGVNLAIRRDEFLLLAGRNGSGKTLLMRHLAGLERPTSGELLFCGQPLARRLKDLRRGLGVVFQDVDCQIVGETVEEDLRFGLENLEPAPNGRGQATVWETALRERVVAAAGELGLAGCLKIPARELSGGEKRRLAIGGVLVLRPSLVILDEPFANLDFPGVKTVLKGILSLRRAGCGVVLITHELEKALAHADRLVILDEGRVAADGKPAVVAREAGKYGLHPLDFSLHGLESCTWLV